MDLGIRGRKAIVCASSKGLGKACAISLAREGCSVVINGRDKETLDQTAREIHSATGAEVMPIVADITTEVGRAVLVGHCPEADILVNNNAGPEPGKFQDWGPEVWARALDGNFLAAAFLMRALLPGMRRRKFGRIVNITSARVKSPTPAMGLSTAARAALTALAKSTSFDAAADNVTINNLLPERIDTDRQREMAERMAEAEGVSYEEARARIATSVPARRFGTPAEFGDACAYLCSAQAGFITGENLRVDGGSYRGLV